MNIQPRGTDGRTWRLTWQAGRDPATGKWRRVRETFHGTQKQAEAYWMKRQPDIQRGIGVDMQGLTLEALWAAWFAAKTDLEVSTRTSYEGLWRTHIQPALGYQRVDQLTPLVIQRAIQHWQTKPRADGKPGTLSARTVGYCRTLVVALLDQAVQWQLVPTNVARVVPGPRQHRHQHTDEDWWTVDQARAFLAVAGSHRLAMAFLLALGVGLREGEILGLRWQDIDWEHQTLSVVQTQKRGDHGYVMGRAKTDAGQRTLAVDARLMQALRLHRTAQKRNRLALQADYHDQDLVVASVVGTPILPSNLRRVADKLMAQAGVPRIKFHDLRHTHASWLIEQGVDIRTVADRLGHTEVSFTMQTYVHSRVDRQRDGATKIGEALWGDQWGDTP